MTHEVIHIGLYVIFGIVLLPVYVMILGWLLGKPHQFRAIALTLGYMVAFGAMIIIGIFLLSTGLSVFTPH